MSYTKLQDNIVEQLLEQKIKNVIPMFIKKKIVNMSEKNITILMQLKKLNVLIIKNYHLNALSTVIFFSILYYCLLIDLIRLLCILLIISSA